MSKIISFIKKNFPIIAILAFLLGSLYVNSISMSYIEELESQVAQRDSLIRELSISNDLVKEYFDISFDSLNHMKTYSLKESKRPVIEKTITQVYVDTVKERTIETITIKTGNDSIVERYNILVNRYNILIDRLKAKSDSLTEASMALGLIKKSFDITYSSSHSGNYIGVHIDAARADSAFMLLPYYRDKIKYDEEKKCWVVETRKKKILFVNE